VKNVKKERIIEFASNNLKWLGAALSLTATLILAFNPERVILFMTPYTGYKITLAKVLLACGTQSAILGFILGRDFEKR